MTKLLNLKPVKFQNQRYFPTEVFYQYTYSSLILGVPNRKLNSNTLLLLKRKARKIFGSKIKIFIQRPNYIYKKANSFQKWHLKTIKAQNQNYIELLPPVCSITLYSHRDLDEFKNESLSDIIVIRFMA